MLVIANKGTMDAGLGEISLMGASTKRGDDTKIGQFGTGNKYAIAYLLRNGYGIDIYTGGKKIELSTETVKVKKQIFEVVCFDGVRTGYTTELGYKWTLWQAIRELYSNALDEGLLKFEMTDTLEFESDTTYFVIHEKDELSDFWLNRYEYFLIDEQPLFKCKFGEIYPKRGKNCRVFKNGIKCYDTDKSSLFDYNFFNLELTEDRIVKYRFAVVDSIHRLFAACDNKSIIRTVLNGLDDVVECDVGDIYTHHDYQDAWKEEISKGQIFAKEMGGWLSKEEQLKTYLVPQIIYQRLINQFGNNLKPKSMKFSDTGEPYVEIELNDFRAKVLSDTVDFFHDAGFVMDYTIKYVDFRDKKVLGSIDQENKLVLIGVLAIDRGVDCVVNTCIEEYIHLKHGVADETRGFQDAIITEFINYMKTK